MVRNFILAALAATLPVALSAQESTTIRPAFIQSGERGPTVLYIADDFRAQPEGDLLVITYERPRPVWHFNSPRDDVNRIHRYLRENSDFGARHMVAIANEKPFLRMFLRPVADLDLASFDLERTTIRPATEVEIAELHAIGTPAFALYLAEAIENRANTVRQMLGEAAASGDQVEMKAVLETAGASRLRSAMRGDASLAGYGLEYEVESERLTVTSTKPYDRELLLAFFDLVCGFAEANAARCVDWTARSLPRQISLSR